ncbi:hypothetical protein PQX77_020876 [Marasmius sp. AFHP31]|nr:hypothetical protein PQX77_020876 [Marasmius sp. AFHP31]
MCWRTEERLSTICSSCRSVPSVTVSTETSAHVAHSSRSVGVYNGLIYDVTDYVRSSGSLSEPNGEVSPGDASGDREFIHPAVIDIFRFNSDGGDITKQLNNLTYFI